MISTMAATFHPADEDDVQDLGYVDAGREKVHRHCYGGAQGRWEPVLTAFIAGTPGFRELFERSLGTSR